MPPGPVTRDGPGPPNDPHANPMPVPLRPSLRRDPGPGRGRGLPSITAGKPPPIAPGRTIAVNRVSDPAAPAPGSRTPPETRPDAPGRKRNAWTPTRVGRQRVPLHPPARPARRLRPAGDRHVPAGLPPDRAGPEGPGGGDATDALALPGGAGGRAVDLRADLRPPRATSAVALRLGRLRRRLPGVRLHPLDRGPDRRPLRDGAGRLHRHGRRAGGGPRLVRRGGVVAGLLDADARYRRRADHLAVRRRLDHG